jgi:hypothetical protein
MAIAATIPPTPLTRRVLLDRRASQTPALAIAAAIAAPATMMCSGRGNTPPASVGFGGGGGGRGGMSPRTLPVPTAISINTKPAVMAVVDRRPIVRSPGWIRSRRV